MRGNPIFYLNQNRGLITAYVISIPTSEKEPVPDQNTHTVDSNTLTRKLYWVEFKSIYRFLNEQKLVFSELTVCNSLYINKKVKTIYHLIVNSIGQQRWFTITKDGCDKHQPPEWQCPKGIKVYRCSDQMLCECGQGWGKVINDEVFKEKGQCPTQCDWNSKEDRRK